MIVCAMMRVAQLGSEYNVTILKWHKQRMKREKALVPNRKLVLGPSGFIEVSSG